MVNPKATRLIIRADARHLPLRDATVDLAIFSPPYFSLRDYRTGHPAELGAEAHWRDWLANLITVTAEVTRVLKPTGSIFCNLGDKYFTHAQGNAPGTKPLHDGRVVVPYQLGDGRGPRPGFPPPKSLMLLPERFRIACVDQLGLTCRAVIIWEKVNGLPESVRDRVRRSHEDWVHLTRGPKYYAALDELREPHTEPWRNGRPEKRQHLDHTHDAVRGRDQLGTQGNGREYNSLGKLPGSVWSIPSEPLRLPPWIDTDHYAAFPTRWPEQLIKGFSPPGVCVQCGQGRFPVVEREAAYDALRARVGDWSREKGRHRNSGGDERPSFTGTIVGYACPCCPHTDHPGTGHVYDNQEIRYADMLDQSGYPNVGAGWGGKSGLGDRPKVGPWREWHLASWSPPPTHPAIVADVFGGTGTTAHVAAALGRIGVSIDLSEAYCKLAGDETLARQRAAKVHGRVNLERQGTLL